MVGFSIAVVLAAATVSQQPASFESLLVSAQQAQAKSDFEAAAGFYARAARLHPELAELNANLGLMYYQTGKDADAIDALLRANRLRPALLVPNLFLGLEYVKQKQFSLAVPYLERAALSKPADVQAQMALGKAYAGIGNTRRAIQAYVRASELQPGDADIWYHLGLSYLEQVEADARILLAQYKDSAYLRALMADNFAERGAFIQAADAYQKALSSGEFPAGTHAHYAFVLLHQGNLPDAERELRSELALDPGSLMARLGMARLNLERGAIQEASDEIASVWTADTGFLGAHVQSLNAGMRETRRSELLKALDELASAGRISRTALKMFRPDAAVNELARPEDASAMAIDANHPDPADANSLYRRGEYRRCADASTRSASPLATRDLRLLTTCAYFTGQYREAFKAAGKLAGTARTQPEGLYWETKSAQGLATEALAHASSIDSNSPRLHILLGDIYRQKKQLSDAEKEYRRALALQPSDTGALFGLSLTLLADSQIEEALVVAQGALRGNPDDPELNAVMGEILCAREDFRESENYLKKSLSTKPEYVSHVHALLGKVYANTDRPEEAITELKLGLPEDKDGHLYFQIGRLYLKMGNRDAADKAFEVSKQLERQGLIRAAVSLQQPEHESEIQ